MGYRQGTVEAEELGVFGMFSRSIDRGLDPFEVGGPCIGPNCTVEMRDRPLISRKLRMRITAPELIVAEPARGVFDQFLYLEGAIVNGLAVDPPQLWCLPPDLSAVDPFV